MSLSNCAKNRGRDFVDVFHIGAEKGVYGIVIFLDSLKISTNKFLLMINEYNEALDNLDRCYHKKINIVKTVLSPTSRGVHGRYKLNNCNVSFDVCFNKEDETNEIIAPYSILTLEFSFGLNYGVKIGINPLEFWDFLVGIIGPDPADDDYDLQIV